MNTNTVPHLTQEIKHRLATGSPFTSASGAWTGGERLADIGDVTFSLSLAADKVLRLRAVRGSEFIGSLALATRRGRGVYDPTSEQAEIERFLGEATGQTQPEIEAAPVEAICPIEQAGLDLAAEYGHRFDGRLDRAVELVKRGEIEFPKYNTAFDPSGFYGFRTCECPDSQHRAPKGKFGCACKHCLSQEIAARIAADAEAVNTREFVEEMARHRAWQAANPDFDRGLAPRTGVN